MFRQVSNKVLVIIFLFLLLSAVFVFFIDGGKNERTFRDVLVNIDTTVVSEILIYPKSQNHKEVKLFKEKENWRVTLSGNKSASVPDKRMTDVFNQLLAIKPQRLAARGEDKWSEFQVDSTGSKVIVKQGDKVEQMDKADYNLSVKDVFKLLYQKEQNDKSQVVKALGIETLAESCKLDLKQHWQL